MPRNWGFGSDKRLFQMSRETVPVITIDGPAGSGKGTIAVKLASLLGYHYLGSGTLYRVLAWFSLHHQAEADDLENVLGMCETMQIRFETFGEDGEVRVWIDGQDISDRLRTEECALGASRLAMCQPVREALLEKQHGFRMAPGLVAEGRDMGTVVFPDARLKIYLTASAMERAQRRHKQLRKQGISASLDDLLAEIEARDARDKERAISPLRPADDAVRVDSTNLTIAQVVQHVAALVKN